VHAEAVHVPEGSWDAVARHGPEQRVQRARLLAEKVPRRIVSRGGLRNFLIGAGLNRVNQVGEEDGILDEEDWDIVANNVCLGNNMLEEARPEAHLHGIGIMRTEVSLISIESGCETMDVSSSISAPSAPRNSRKPNKDGCLLPSC
jgi:hypothetical protein